MYTLYCYEETDDAFVSGHLHQVSAQIDGTVQVVGVGDNGSVRTGDVLVKLNPLEFQLERRRAEAGLAQARADQARADAASLQATAQASEAEAHAGQAGAQIGQARAQLDLARINRDRTLKLFHEGGASTQSDMDNAQSAYNVAEAALEASQANGRAQEASIASARAAIASAKAQDAAAIASVAAGEAAVADAQRKLGYAQILAPANGRIGNKNVEPGNRVQAGQTLLVVVEPNPWIVANFKETQLARLHAGMPAEITVDALPGRVLHGTIDSIAPASGAQFALLPADNATGNFTKVVQRVPVKVVLAPDDLKELGDRVRPGLSAVVSVRIR
jgi:membrane fusion protein (multidrug efflux system)